MLDDSVAMCGLLADGKPADVAYAETVLDAAYDAAYLELALRSGLPLAALDADLKKAAQAAVVAQARLTGDEGKPFQTSPWRKHVALADSATSFASRR